MATITPPVWAELKVSGGQSHDIPSPVSFDLTIYVLKIEGLVSNINILPGVSIPVQTKVDGSGSYVIAFHSPNGEFEVSGSITIEGGASAQGTASYTLQNNKNKETLTVTGAQAAWVQPPQ